MASYSRRALLDKLGIKEGATIRYLNPPRGYAPTLGPPTPRRRGLARQVEGRTPGVQLVRGMRHVVEGRGGQPKSRARRRVAAGQLAEHAGIDPTVAALPEQGIALLVQDLVQNPRSHRRRGVSRQRRPAVVHTDDVSPRQGAGVVPLTPEHLGLQQEQLLVAE